MKRMQEVAMMKEYREETGKNILTNKDFTKVAFRSGILSGTYNYQTMMGAGFGAAIAPELKSFCIYGKTGQRAGSDAIFSYMGSAIYPQDSYSNGRVQGRNSGCIKTE